MEKLEYLKIGKIVKMQGLKGEVRVYPYTDDIKRFDDLDKFYIDKNEECEVEKVRYQKNVVILKLKGINTIEEAERLKDKMIYVTREDSKELDEEEFFISDMIGIKAMHINGEEIGVLKEVLKYSANDVYVIEGKDNEGNKKDYLIPSVKKFVPTIDIKERIMVIDPIKGMLE